MELAKLAEPFPAEDVEWKPSRPEIGADGKVGVLAYITARAIMTRLDEVCGPENWRVSYRHEGKRVMCCLSIRVTREEGTWWVDKWDGAEETDFEPVKGGISSALKRAGVVLGIGRYLYQLDSTRTPARTLKRGERTPPGWKWTPDFIYQIPELPAWALPGGSGRPPAEPQKGPQKPAEDPLVTTAQLNQIVALVRDTELSEEKYLQGLQKHYGRDRTEALSRAEAKNLIERLEALRQAQIADDVDEAFGGDGRLGKLREQALGYCETIGQRGRTVELPGGVTFEELREMIGAAGDEKELEGVILKLEKVLEEIAP